MDGRQASHVGKPERSNKRAIAQPPPEETEDALPPSFVVVVLQCFSAEAAAAIYFGFYGGFLSSPIKMDLMTDDKSFFSGKNGDFIWQLLGCRAPCRVTVDANVFLVRSHFGL